MTRLALDRVTDFGDFGRGAELRGLLKQAFSRSRSSDVRVSPDGRHVHVILRTPASSLQTFDRNPRAHPGPGQKGLDLAHPRSAPIVDLLYLDHAAPLLAVVCEDGRSEIWRFREPQSGWQLLQTLDLCNSPRARVVSACVCLNLVVWCEERPPSSESPSASGPPLRFCICSRSFELDRGGLGFGGVRIALHNSPRYRVVGSGENVYLLPEGRCPGTVSRFFLSWSPRRDSFAVNSACRGLLHRKSSPASRESDFRGLIAECVGVLSAAEPPGIRAWAPTGCGGLLLLLTTGWVCAMQKDGVLRRVYKLPDNCVAGPGAPTGLNVYRDVVALVVGQTLFLIDTKCGVELEKIALKKEGLLFVNCLESHTPHLLSDSGLFVVTPGGGGERVSPASVLAEAVFEEACKYYQQRSLSSTPLTVEKLKKGGMFQAPIALAAILGDYLSADPSKHAGGHDKLLRSLDGELKTLVAMESLRTSMVKASEKDLESLCQTLVQQEVGRLLCADVERDNLLYLNSIFQMFPAQAWQALRAVLQLRCNGDGSLSTHAPAEVWKSVLAPVQVAANFSHAPVTAPLPVFELLCSSVFQFQPGWLPRFLEAAQRQAGSVSATSSWSYGVKDTAESLPLYKRALAVLPDDGQHQDLEVELLLCSQRPNAVMQALRILMGLRQWARVTETAQRFCRQSPLLNKEIFAALLCEVSQHRDLDPYLDLLWALCPEDLTVTSILNMVLKNLPPSSAALDAGPFRPGSRQPTVGLLKPLLSRVLQRESRPSRRYADILQSPTFPPPAPPRQPAPGGTRAAD
ncbi:Hermansky-Pudlak syndrome 6 protein [Denticeps clupeoides]|uniref:Uncharacterized protein n=1 Tax=Denticeps clupeoides TaxID=299321 RepID=A0AAY4D865_9TELE|nr:Hermansky-Pudlak syndrome 6 protein [Denticeps clupeoides]